MGVFLNREELVAARSGWKRDGRKVVFTNGCYDLLHPGHIRLLESARSLGDILILALNTDDSVARLKGPSRPLLALEQRAAMANALEAVDVVTSFDEDTPRELIAAVLPESQLHKVYIACDAWKLVLLAGLAWILAPAMKDEL